MLRREFGCDQDMHELAPEDVPEGATVKLFCCETCDYCDEVAELGLCQL